MKKVIGSSSIIVYPMEVVEKYCIKGLKVFEGSMDSRRYHLFCDIRLAMKDNALVHLSPMVWEMHLARPSHDDEMFGRAENNTLTNTEYSTLFSRHLAQDREKSDKIIISCHYRIELATSVLYRIINTAQWD